MMEKLIILDYCNAEVHVYDTEKDVFIDEDYIESLGFDYNDCQWMWGDLSIMFHKHDV